MKIIIAGGRNINPSFVRIHECLAAEGWTPTEIVSGGARGVDACGELYAKSNNINVPIKLFIADWDQYGRSAGPIRNAQMAKYADALLLIWDGHSRGSMSMKNEALKAGIPVHEFIHF